ncbi:MAG TPA: helix-hairpin-helix domain-containing protein, partial [Thermodesulfobacteriota bacterium]|nr:helix-hairpin-helix domain-containing protein [Thermodesulfobacteriota bacterium]
MRPADVARIFDEIALLLEIKGENPYKVRAYQNAARALEGLREDLGELVRSGRLREIRGIGEALAEKITELVTTGRLRYYERLAAEVPPPVVELARVPGLSPRRARTVYEALGVSTIGELEYAIHENRLLALPGFGPKVQANILAGIERLKRARGRLLLFEADQLAEALLAEAARAGLEVELAGEWRRRMETVGGYHLVVAADEPEAAAAAVERLPAVGELRARRLDVAVTAVRPAARGAALAL